MNLSGLSAEAMVQLTHAWISGPVRAQIEAIPVLASALPAVEAAHRALIDTQASSQTPTEDLRRLTERAVACDRAHDNAVAGTVSILEGLAEVHDDSSYLELRDFLLPKGRATIQLSYDAEAGAAELLAARLLQDPAKKKRLKTLLVDDKPLLSIVEGWIKSARLLGELARERAALLAQENGPSDADLRALRNTWIKKVRAFYAVAELANLDEATHTAIFGRLEAVKKAPRTKAAAASSNSGEPDT